jgi:radical SAM protein with 4Fe4S-binding SPASM domain
LHITTNGLLLNEEKCKKIVDIGIDSIIFSMQGLTKEDYEIDRNNKKYEVLLKNVKYLHKIRRNSEKPYITINSTYTESRDASYESHPPSTSIDYINDFKEFWFQYADDVKVGKTNWARIDNSIGQHIDCKEPWQKLSVDWDGEVSACCGDYDRLMNIGNINEQSLYQLWDNNYILDSYRNLITNGKHNSLSLCSKCYPAHGNIWEKK